MPETFDDLDVRPILAEGGHPIDAILHAVDLLPPGAGLRVLAPFKPVPLLALMADKGYGHEARPLEGDDWEVLFRPEAAGPFPADRPDAAGAWPEPSLTQDSRALEPPEPMVRILGALEEIGEGDVLEALLPREPLLLLPELDRRGCAWRGAAAEDGSYRILIRKGRP